MGAEVGGSEGLPVIMTDVWCFTCSHEIRENFIGGYAHLDPDDRDGCPCIEDGEECRP